MRYQTLRIRKEIDFMQVWPLIIWGTACSQDHHNSEFLLSLAGENQLRGVIQSLGPELRKDPSPLPARPAVCSSPWASFSLSAHPFQHLLDGNPFYKELFQIDGWDMLLISKLISRCICGKTATSITRVMIKYPIFSQLLLLLQTANAFQLTSKENFWYVLKTSPLPFIPISLIRPKTNKRKPSICMHINPVSGALITRTESEALPLVLKCISSTVLSDTSGKEGNRVDCISY